MTPHLAAAKHALIQGMILEHAFTYEQIAEAAGCSYSTLAKVWNHPAKSRVLRVFGLQSFYIQQYIMPQRTALAEIDANKPKYRELKPIDRASIIAASKYGVSITNII
jgi:hypothetical protein